ncbi:MAG: sulfotransferase [Phycisphaerales bacterium]
MSRLPDFLVIGAQKSGTSSLCDVLGRHPDVFVCDPKEPYFFSHAEVWARGMDWYRERFAAAGDARMIGEGSTTYTQHHLYPDAPARLAEHLPNARLIFIARDPLERIRSHWMHLRSRENRETRPFNEAVRERPEYLDHSRYDHQLSLYRAHYPDAQMLVLQFEPYRADPGPVIERTLAFLGVDPDVPLAPRASAQHASNVGMVDTPATGILRKIPAFRHLRDLAPAPLRSMVRGALKRPIGDKPEYDAETRQWVIDELRADIDAFSGRYDIDRSAWSI